MNEANAAIADQDIDGGHWLVAIGDRQMGPYSTMQLALWVKDKRLDDECLAWREGMQSWVPLRAIPDIRHATPVPGEAVHGVAPGDVGVVADFRVMFGLCSSPLDTVASIGKSRLSAMASLLFFVLLLPVTMQRVIGEQDEPLYLLSLATGCVLVLALVFFSMIAFRLAGSPSRHWIDPFLMVAGMVAPMVPACAVVAVLGWTWVLLPGVLAAGMITYMLLVRAFRALPVRGFYVAVLLCASAVWVGDGMFRHGVGAVSALFQKEEGFGVDMGDETDNAGEVSGSEIINQGSTPAKSSTPELTNDLGAEAAKSGRE